MLGERLTFRKAGQEQADDVARLMNACRYFPRTSIQHFQEAFHGDFNPKHRGAFWGQSADESQIACVQYYFHPYQGYTGWIACSPSHEDGLVDDCLDFTQGVFDDLQASSYGIVVADKFPTLIERLEARGFTQTSQEIYQSLALKDFEASFGEARVAALELQGYRFVTLEELDQQGRLSLYSLELEVAADIPNLAISRQPAYEEFVKDLERDEPHHRFCVAALLGQAVVAVAQHRARSEGYFACAGTGVCRAARGQGLALATKFIALRRIKQAGGVCVETCNDIDNVAMLRLNKKVGFAQAGRQFLYRSKTSTF